MSSLSKKPKLDGQTRQLVHEKVEKIKKGYEDKIQRLNKEIEDIKLEMKTEEEEHPGKIEKLENEYHETRDAIDSVKSQIEDIRMKIGPYGDIEHMVWGAETFFKGKELGTSLYDSYEEWFDGISKIMEDNTPYRTSKYIFMKRDIDLDYFEKYPGHYKRYVFQGVEIEDPWDAFDNADDNIFMFEDLFRGLWEKGSFVLLHPKKIELCREFERAVNATHNYNNYSRWYVEDVTSDFCKPGFAMMVGILNKISL